MRVLMLYMALIPLAILAIGTDKLDCLGEDLAFLHSRSATNGYPRLHKNKNTDTLFRKDDDDLMIDDNHRYPDDEDFLPILLARMPPRRNPHHKTRTKAKGEAPPQITNDPSSLVGHIVLTHQGEQIQTARKTGFDALRKAHDYGAKADAAHAASVAESNQGNHEASEKFLHEKDKLSALEKQHINEAVQHHEQAHEVSTTRKKMKYAGWRLTQGISKLDVE